MGIIAATGHRPPKLGGYSERVNVKLRALAKAYLRECEADVAISGMALGWDQAFAEAALDLEIPLICAIPFHGQHLQWPGDSQMRWHRICSRAWEVHVVSPEPYHPSLMQVRNMWMVERAERLCALWNGSLGGTWNCIMYAKARKMPIDNLWPKFADQPST